MASVILTVADHDQNGFVALAKWTGLTEQAAREFIEATDRSIQDEAEPDSAGPFNFILDLVEGEEWSDMIDTGKRFLPTQTAMSLAPDAVRQWLEERPDPDSVFYRAVPAGRALLSQENREIEG